MNYMDYFADLKEIRAKERSYFTLLVLDVKLNMLPILPVGAPLNPEHQQLFIDIVVTEQDLWEAHQENHRLRAFHTKIKDLIRVSAASVTKSPTGRLDWDFAWMTTPHRYDPEHRVYEFSLVCRRFR